MAPPLQVGHQDLGPKLPKIGRKMGKKLSEDLFLIFFALHLILGEKLQSTGEKNFGPKMFISTFSFPQIF